MISDEMRELLSAYVDGELRDADAARVEDVSKRDPELRREIEAYRTLRKKLKEWDAVEHGGDLPPAFVSRVVSRARAMDMALAAPVRRGVFGPLAIAAALLVAVGAGYVVARSAAPAAPSLPEPIPSLALRDLGPAPGLSLEGSALAPADPRAPDAASRTRIDDHILSRRALELEDAMRREEFVRATPPEPEPGRRTGPRLSAAIRAMVGNATARAAPRDALVVLARPLMLSGLPSLEAAPSGRRIAHDQSDARIREVFAGTSHVLAPLGEIWTGRDGRTRLVARSDWIPPREDMLVRVVWGDANAPSNAGELLEVQETILGPKARRRLLAAKPGPDADFLAWLKGAYAASLPTLLAADAKERDRAMNKLLDALRADEKATGFAVFDAKGSLLGVEMFHDHAAMLVFAPRLLRGYLLEAGEDGIRVTPPLGGAQVAKVQDFLDALPGIGLRVDQEPLEDKAQGYERAPKGLVRVNLVTATGEVRAHGLVVGDTPVHLTLFGE